MKRHNRSEYYTTVLFIFLGALGLVWSEKRRSLVINIKIYKFYFDYIYDFQLLYLWRLKAVVSHYSKSQIFVQKFNFDKTPTFSRVFHRKFFWQYFSWNHSCQQLKSPKPRHFHEFFTQIIFDNFSREIKVVNS